jgi:putative DNA primase/helicase
MVQQDAAERFVSLIEGEAKTKLFIYSDAYANSLGIPGANLLDEDWRRGMKEILLGNNVKVWVVDNIASLAPGIDENSKQDWDPINKWFLELRFAGITTIFLHHANKDGRQRGTSGREDNIDISILLDKPKNYVPEEGARFVVKFEKARIRHEDLPLISDTEFVLQPDGEGRQVWNWGNLKGQNKVQVMKMLDEGMSANEIAEELQLSRGRVSQIKAGAV